MKNTSNPQTLCDLNEHRRIFDIKDLFRFGLSEIKSKSEDVRVRFAQIDETGGYKAIHECIQSESANPIGVQFERFIADHGDLQRIQRLELRINAIISG